MHSIRLRLLAEKIFRRRATDDATRYAGSLRRARIETNPHQIDAVHFALERIPEGGCILADEVGLGKTIEAGLVIAQLVAEGRDRILILVPLALASQWQAELAELLGVESTVVTRRSWVGRRGNPFERRGVYIVGREFAAGDRALVAIREMGPWDLVVVDEAHEQFATIYRRFGQTGVPGRRGATSGRGAGLGDTDRGPARRAAKLKEAFDRTPFLLLTATPLQNSLLELWGLVQYVDPDGALLGPLDQFRALYTDDASGRVLNEDRADELSVRLQQIVHRTLRRQAQPFLEFPFPKRHALTVDFRMTGAEREIYEAVGEYLDGGGAEWMGAGARRLVLLGLRRRMGSSMAALVSSLESLRRRIGEAIEGRDIDLPGWMTTDLDETDEDPPESRVSIDPVRLAAEAEWIDDLLVRARRLATDSKSRAFLELVGRLVASGEKLVVFTESLATQADLARRLEAGGFEGQVTLFNGSNDTPSASRALARWEEEVGHFLPPDDRPSRSVAVRRALIHEFRHRTRILISTEAGAKGLNLQFANKVVNYDLPWNPQRIEQRIGRCHRYRQEKDVVVVNFVNLDNEAERRVHQLLSEKFHLFDRTFDTSDELLGCLVASVDLEGEVRKILEGSTGASSIEAGFDDLEARIERVRKRKVRETWKRTKRLLSRLDSSVRARLSSVSDDLSRDLAGHDRDLADLVETWVGHRGGAVDRAREGDNLVLQIDVDPSFLPRSINGTRTFHVGPPDPGAAKGEHLTPEHPLLSAIRADALGAVDPETVQAVRFDRSAAAEVLGGAAEAGRRGFWASYRLTFHGLESQERLVQVAALRESDGSWRFLDAAVAERLEELPCACDPANDVEAPEPAAVAAALEAMLEEGRASIRREQEGRVRRLLARTERQEKDARLYLEKRLTGLRAELEEESQRELEATTVEELEEAMGRRRRLERQLEDLESRARSERAARRETSTVRRRDLLRRRLVTDVEVVGLFRAAFRIV